MTNGIDNCCGDCHQPKGCECPDIVPSGQIEISHLEDDIIDIFAPHNPTVTSDDGSVDIVETENSPGSINYDLSVDGEDYKVGGCDTDPNPGTLNRKLYVESPLTKVVRDCETDGKVVLGVDTSLIADEKVKVSGGCGAVYLEDTLVGRGGIQVYKEDCSMIIDFDETEHVRPYAKLALGIDYEVVFPHGQNNWVILPMHSEYSNNPGEIDWLQFGSVAVPSISHPTYGVVGATTKYIEIRRNGFYRVSMSQNVGINYGIHAMRGCVLSDSDQGLLLDDKIGEPPNYAINFQAIGNARDNVIHTKQVSFSRCDVFYLEIGDRLYLGGRVATEVTNGLGSGADGWTIYRRAGLSGGILGTGGVYETDEAGCTLSVEWVSSPDGNILYN